MARLGLLKKLSRNASDSDIREHLVSVHGIDPDSANKMDREELLSLHNLLHNAETRASAPSSSCPSGNCPTSRGSSSSCPSGNCPTSRGSSTRSRGCLEVAMSKIMRSAAWQRKEGKNPSGGLNAKGRASYNKQTGGNLVGLLAWWAKKKSFCARMSGILAL